MYQARDTPSSVVYTHTIHSLTQPQFVSIDLYDLYAYSDKDSAHT